jgi:hypothetical protein
MLHIAFTKLQGLLEDRIQLNTQNTPGVDPTPMQIFFWRTPMAGRLSVSGYPYLNGYQSNISLLLL